MRVIKQYSKRITAIAMCALLMITLIGTQSPVHAAVPGSFSSSASKSVYSTTEDIVLSWTKSANAQWYGLTITKYPYGSANKVWERDPLYGNSITVGKLPAGQYRFNMLGYNSQGSSPLSNLTYFTVEAHQHSYQNGYEPAHPHKEYKKCTSCGDIQWLGTNKYLSNCSTCNPTTTPSTSSTPGLTDDTPSYVEPEYGFVPEEQHQHAYVYYYEATHPHKEFNKCSSCGDVQWLGTNKKLSDCKECNPATEKLGYVYNTGGVGIHLRSGPGTNYSSLGGVPEGATVTITGNVTNNFYPIKYGGKSGYGSKTYITETKPVASTAVSSSKIDALKKSYPQGSKWTSSFGGASQCHGFALLVCDSLFGSHPNYDPGKKWSMHYNADNIKVGDLVRYNNTYANHSIVITKISGDTLTFVDCNGAGGVNVVKWDNTISKSALKTKMSKKLMAGYGDSVLGPGYVWHCK